MAKRAGKRKTGLITWIAAVCLLGFWGWIIFVPQPPSVVVAVRLFNPTDVPRLVTARLNNTDISQTVTVGPGVEAVLVLGSEDSVSAFGLGNVELLMVDSPDRQVFWTGSIDNLLGGHFRVSIPDPPALWIRDGDLARVESWFASHEASGPLHYQGVRWRPLQLAVLNRQVEVIDYLVSRDADPCLHGDLNGSPGPLTVLDTPLNIAFREMMIPELASLMRSSWVDRCACSKHGFFVVVEYAANDIVQEARRIVAQAISPECAAELDRQLALGACLGCYEDGPGMLAWLHANNPGVFAVLANEVVSPYLGVIYSDGSLEQSERLFDLLRDFGVPYDSPMSKWDGKTPLLIACDTPRGMSLLVPLARRLIVWGADVNASDENGVTPLIAASGNANATEELCVMLIEAGADVNSSDTQGRSPLGGAVRLGRLNLAKAMIERGAMLPRESEHASGERTELISLIESCPAPIEDRDSMIEWLRGRG